MRGTGSSLSLSPLLTTPSIHRLTCRHVDVPRNKVGRRSSNCIGNIICSVLWWLWTDGCWCTRGKSVIPDECSLLQHHVIGAARGGGHADVLLQLSSPAVVLYKPVSQRQHDNRLLSDPAAVSSSTIMQAHITTCQTPAITPQCKHMECSVRAVILLKIAMFWYLFLQLIKGNTFAGTAFFSYGAFWTAFFVLKYITAASIANGHPAFGAGYKVGTTLIDCLWGVFTFGFFIPTLRKNGCLMTIFGTLWVTFFLLAGGVWNPHCGQAAGYIGFVCGASAIYTAFAEIYHESLGIMMPGLRPVRFI